MGIEWGNVQRRLAERGFQPGTIDGVAGALSYAALLAFAAGRAVDGLLATLARAAAIWLPRHAIDRSPARLAEFVAQTAHETGGYRVFVERLDYSADALRRCWPERFPSDAAAAALAGKPRSIAEACYGGRMGNDAPGDGWRYRGRGLIQLTGKANYAQFGAEVGIDLIADPDRAADPDIAMRLACAYWTARRVNAAVDAGDFVQARRLTNGGRIGLEDVATRRGRLLSILDDGQSGFPTTRAPRSTVTPDMGSQQSNTLLGSLIRGPGPSRSTRVALDAGSSPA